MKRYLGDISFWLALIWDGHARHTAARRWFQTVPPGALVQCRLAELGVLRLLTNRTVMEQERLAPVEAMAKLQLLSGDVRIGFQPEPPGWRFRFESLVRGQQEQGYSIDWTDTYLAAFAYAAGLAIVTLDRDFERFADLPKEILI